MVQNAPAYKQHLADLQKYQDLNQSYQHKVEKYNRLYYCYVCDVIFDPEDKSGRVAPPEQMAQYLAS
jgi:penicillin V acylase-like amidase (Ntn superfamily)